MRNIIVFLALLISSNSFSLYKYCDKTVNPDYSLVIIFTNPNPLECGEKIITEPKHASISKLEVPVNQTTTTYTYHSLSGFTGMDTVVILEGCMINGTPEIAGDTTEYHIKVDPDYSFKNSHENIFDVFFDNKFLSILKNNIEISKEQVIIFNMNGMLVFSDNFTTNPIDLSYLPSNIYILTILSDRKPIFTRKFIKR